MSKLFPTSGATEQDVRFMRYALGLATRGLGDTFPNPTVGCVIVKNDQIIGVGRTGKGGRPHAETEALAQAGANAKGATLYVSLEPCSIQSKTPPCTDALIKTGITRVVIACVDSNPKINGQGIDALQKAGIEVLNGVCEKEALALNAGFFMRLTENRPRVSLKIASSLDGFMANAKGESQWITGEAARTYGHMLRATHEAVLTGIGTVLADDPALTCRIPGLENRSPLCFVIDRKGRMPKNSKLAASGAKSLQEKTLSETLAYLAGEGVNRLLVEAGPTLSSAFYAEGFVDEIYWFRAPIIMGQGRPALERFSSAASPSDLPRWSRREIITLGSDVVEIYSR